MKLTRRHVVQLLGAGAVAPLAARASQAAAQDPMHATPADTQHAQPSQAAPTSAPHDGRYTPVRTLNGWTLPYNMVDGVKEFHLVAEEIVHEFAPGCVAKCWGYNGTTPGPTIEAVEGDRLRIYVTNRLPEHTNVHWHGILLPNGMDGVGGVTQRNIQPGETYVYEFTLKQHGTHKYHPHADEMVQMAMGMMGLLIIHPKDGEPERIDRDYAILLHNWALHPGTYRPDPSVLQDFDLWTFNSKVFPAIDTMVAATGDRVRVRVANLSMWNHPIHMHGVQFHVTGSDGGRWPRNLWRPETTEIVGVGQTRDFEFVAVPGDWAFHCHMSHHTMNAMGHEVPNTIGIDTAGVEGQIRKMLPGYMTMGQGGMAEHQEHTDSGHMTGPENTLPMMMGKGPFGNIEMGGMFTLIKVRDGLGANDYGDPGWFAHPPGTQPRLVSSDPQWGNPVRRGLPADTPVKFESRPVDHSKMKHS